MLNVQNPTYKSETARKINTGFSWQNKASPMLLTPDAGLGKRADLDKRALRAFLWGHVATFFLHHYSVVRACGDSAARGRAAG